MGEKYLEPPGHACLGWGMLISLCRWSSAPEEVGRCPERVVARSSRCPTCGSEARYLASGEAVARLDDMRRSVAKEMNRIMGAALIWVLLWAKEKQTGIRRQQGRPAYKLERCRLVGRVCISFGRAKTKKINCTRILTLNRRIRDASSSRTTKN